MIVITNKVSYEIDPKYNWSLFDFVDHKIRILIFINILWFIKLNQDLI